MACLLDTFDNEAQYLTSKVILHILLTPLLGFLLGKIGPKLPHYEQKN